MVEISPVDKKIPRHINKQARIISEPFKPFDQAHNMRIKPADQPGKGFLILHSQTGNFFVTNIQGVKYWIRTLEEQANDRSDNIEEDGMIPIILKFRLNERKHLPDSHGETQWDRKTDRYIPPEGLMVWDGYRWQPIQEWINIDLSLFISYDDENNPFVKDPYVTARGLRGRPLGYPLPPM
jgi:hypothetical protein